jgi:hypothetical protein
MIVRAAPGSPEFGGSSPLPRKPNLVLEPAMVCAEITRPGKKRLCVDKQLHPEVLHVRVDQSNLKWVGPPTASATPRPCAFFSSSTIQEAFAQPTRRPTWRWRRRGEGTRSPSFQSTISHTNARLRGAWSPRPQAPVPIPRPCSRLCERPNPVTRMCPWPGSTSYFCATTPMWATDTRCASIRPSSWGGGSRKLG